MRRQQRWGVVLALLGALAASSRADAYCRTTVCQDCELDPLTGCMSGQPIGWRTSCVTYSMQRDGSTHVGRPEAVAAVSRAFQAWRAVRCPGGAPPAIEVRTSFGDAACRRHEYNQTDGNANIVMFRDDDWPYSNAANALALTTVTYNFKTGEIYDADLEVNATEELSVADDPAPFAFDLQSIITHEAGHFLGLNHSLQRQATMWAEYSRGSAGFRELARDDIEGICAAYPPAPSATCSETPRQGFSPTCGIAPTSGGSCAVHAVGGGPGAYGAGCAAILALGALSARSLRAGLRRRRVPARG